ncbi:hypothetical protein ACTXN7_09250 [Corynebacterium flavescens]|uniref:hypothetical protein n=1 Tax=Corynebacterium flavescens TaxID=28028 RepID=UPI002648FBDA|nr:hypothetical protein [Corynebacterium flavescens]MDN6236461.1 hypothetical protein [Corynebacterium flavescens]
MRDPREVDSTLRALRETWEGRPELSLATLFAMLQNQGIGWGASDEELVSALEHMSHVRPSLVPLADGRVSEGRWLLLTSGHRVTVDKSFIVVRPVNTRGVAGQPVVWPYRNIRGAGPARPLVVTDDEGFEHRLGVVESVERQRIQRTEAHQVLALEDISRADIGDTVLVVRTEESMIVIDHGLHSFEPLRRELRRRDYSWQKIKRCIPGQELLVQSGGSLLTFPAVEGIWVAEDPLPPH